MPGFSGAKKQMPNWCENDLIVEGSREGLLDFLAFISGPNGVLDFDRICPYPEEFAALDEAAAKWDTTPGERGIRPTDGFNSGGYEWCIEIWGTKWNARRVSVEKLDDNSSPGACDASVTLHFDTAWSPPSPLIPIVSQRFPDLRFDLRFYECGMGFQGRLCCRGGAIEDELVEDYDGDRGG